MNHKGEHLTQTMLSATSKLSGVSEPEARQAAELYLANKFSNKYHATNGFYGNGHWYFLVRAYNAAGELGTAVGKILVDAFSGNVIALTDEQIEAIQASSLRLGVEPREAIVRDERGYILRQYAQGVATRWLSDHLTMHFSATDALFIPLDPPLWQLSIRFRLPQTGEIKPLGVIDVNALTGEVASLSRKQIRTIQERVHAIIRHCELAAAA